MTITKQITVVLGALLCAGLTSNAQETKEFVLKDIKPTLTGYTNNAIVTTELAHSHMVFLGNDSYTNKELTVFTRNRKVDSRLVMAKQGIVWGNRVPYSARGAEIGNDESGGIEGAVAFSATDGSGIKKLGGDAHVTIDGDTEFTGNLDYDGSIYTFFGTVRLLKHVFSSDTEDPLVFKLVMEKGFVYVKGKGKVTLPDGKVLTVPTTEK